MTEIVVELVEPSPIEIEFPVGGVPGVGVPPGGTTGQVLAKDSGDDYDTEWVDQSGGGGAVDSVNGEIGDVVLTQDDVLDGTTAKQFTVTEETKLAGIETGAEVNNISDANVTDLTDGNDTTLHFHSTDRARANHTGTQLASTISDFSTATDARITIQKGAANGIASLDGSSKIDSAQLPALAITEAFAVASQAAMLALAAQQGDVAIRSDINKTFILSTNSPGTLADWLELKTPTDAVLSFNSRTGAIAPTAGDYSATQITNTPSGNIVATELQSAINELDTEKVPTTRTINGQALSANVTLAKSDVGLSNVDNTADTAKPVSTAQQTALDLKLNITAYDDADVTEVNTGTSTAKYVSPDSLAGSYAGSKPVAIQVLEAATVWTTGDGKAYFRIPPSLNGMDLISVGVGVNVASSSGTPTIQIARGRQPNATTAHAYVDMLSTLLTIDALDFDSKDAGTPAVINASNDDVLTGDLIRVDIDVAGTATAGLNLTLTFRLP